MGNRLSSKKRTNLATVWTNFFYHQYLSPPQTFDAVVDWVISKSLRPKLKTICRIIFQVVVYVLWRERNARLHSSAPKASQSLVKEIQLILRAKLVGLDRSN